MNRRRRRNCIKVEVKSSKDPRSFRFQKEISKFWRAGENWKMILEGRVFSFLHPYHPLSRSRERQDNPFLSLSFYSPTPPLPFEIEDFPQVKSIRLCYEPGRNSLMERTTLSIAGCAPRIFKEATLDDEGISGREGFFHWIFYVVIWAFY